MQLPLSKSPGIYWRALSRPANTRSPSASFVVTLRIRVAGRAIEPWNGFHYARELLGLASSKLAPVTTRCTDHLGGHGPKVTVADHFPVRWNDQCRPQFYRRLLEEWGSTCRALEGVIRPAIQAVSSRGRGPGRGPPLNPHSDFDVVLSNAVLEHVYELAAVVRELARVTVPGGIGSHQVDFWDHKNLRNRWNFLLMNDATFVHQFRKKHWRIQHRWRHCEVVSLFSSSWIRAIEEAPPTELATAAYIASYAFLDYAQQVNRVSPA